MNRKAATVISLGLAQTLAWASSFYLPAVLAVPMAADLGVTPAWVYGGLTLALVVTAFLGPAVGRWIDHGHGRRVLCFSNLVFAAGLLLLSTATGPLSLFAAWLFLGLAMSLGLYDPAFAVVTSIYGAAARPLVTGITLFAGFASTVGWPTTAALAHEFGWRGACTGWAIAHLTVGLLLNAWAVKGQKAREEPAIAAPSPTSSGVSTEFGRMDWILMAFFAAVGFVGTGTAAQLPRILQVLGATSAAAIALAALMGPAQVTARIVEFGFLRRQHPLVSARLAAALPIVGVLAFAIIGPMSLAVFSMLLGAGNGLTTIARGTLPLAIFGPAGFGARVGRITAPARVAQAFAPLVLGYVIDQIGAGVLWVSASVSALAFACLFFVRDDAQRVAPTPPN